MSENTLKCPYCNSRRLDIPIYVQSSVSRFCRRCHKTFFFKQEDTRIMYFSDADFSIKIAAEDKRVVKDAAKNHNIPKGMWEFQIQNRTTREYKCVIAKHGIDACNEFGWLPENCWILPLAYGGDEKKETEVSSEKTETKSSAETPRLKTVKTTIKTTIKTMVISIIAQESSIGHDQVLEKIAEVLKARAVEKGKRSDSEHLKMRAKLSYYFYKKEIRN